MSGAARFFGLPGPDGPPRLDTASAEALMDEAHARAAAFAAVPLDAVLGVLDATGRAWFDPAYPRRSEALRRLPEVISFSPPMIERTLALLPGLLSRASLSARLRAEFGPGRRLEGWGRPDKAGSSVRVLPRGVLLHVSAGNVFLGCVDSLVMGLVTRNVNVLKLSSADPYFPVEFLASLAEHDPEGLVAPAVALVRWKGGDPAVEAVLKRRCDTILVWGGEEAVRSYRTGLGLGTRLVEHGPKLSGGVITARGLEAAGADAVARGLALDLSMWDQAACSSPQTVYIQDSGGERGAAARRLARALAPALEAVAAELPPGRLSLDEQVEVRKFRELARFATAQGEGELFESAQGLDHTVFVDDRPGFVLSPLGRTLILKPFRRFEEILPDFTEVGAYLQCVALEAHPDELDELTLRLSRAGAGRFCRPGRMSEGRPGTPHDGGFPMADLVRLAGLEVETEAELAPASLRRVLEAARRGSRFHAERLNGLDLSSPRTLGQVPLMSAQDVRLNSPPAGDGLPTGPLEGVVVFASGGSTGSPKFSYYSNAEFERVVGVLADSLAAAGLAPGDRVANLFVAGGLWSSFLAVHLALGRLPCLNLPIGGHVEPEALLEHLRIFRPNVLIGLPSMIVSLAELTARSPADPPLRFEKLFYGGEHVPEELKAYLSRVLGVTTVRSAGYASVDAGTIGFQCRESRGSEHHLAAGHQWMELLEPETGRPVTGGEAGQIVVTSLERFLTPIVRYGTGDLGRWVPGPCPCGRPEPRFELLGRCDDRLQVGAARILVGDVVRGLATLPGVAPLCQLEASQEQGRDQLILRVELAAGDRPGAAPSAVSVREAVLAACRDLRDSVERGWLARFQVELLAPGGLPRVARTGKVRPVVDLRHGRGLGYTR